MKKKELLSLTPTQLQEKHAELTAHYNKMKFAHGVTNLENPLQLRTIRRDIARLNTLISASK